MQVRMAGTDASTVPASSPRSFGRRVEPWLYLAPALLIFTALCLSADALVEHPAGLAVIAAALAAAWGLLHLGTEARRYG